LKSRVSQGGQCFVNLSRKGTYAESSSFETSLTSLVRVHDTERVTPTASLAELTGEGFR